MMAGKNDLIQKIVTYIFEAKKNTIFLKTINEIERKLLYG